MAFSPSSASLNPKILTRAPSVSMQLCLMTVWLLYVCDCAATGHDDGPVERPQDQAGDLHPVTVAISAASPH